MNNPNDMSPRQLKAWASGNDSFGQWGSAVEHERYKDKVLPRSRRQCHCCKRRATHVGKANGVALITGCEMLITKWVNKRPTVDQIDKDVKP